jgi:hypothetical protein
MKIARGEPVGSEKSASTKAFPDLKLPLSPILAKSIPQSSLSISNKLGRTDFVTHSTSSAESGWWAKTLVAKYAFQYWLFLASNRVT